MNCSFIKIYSLAFNTWHATNYLVKDVSSEERIEEVLLKAIEEAKEKKSEYLLLTGVGEYRNVPISDIRYFEIMQKIVTVYYADATFEFVSTMERSDSPVLMTSSTIRTRRSLMRSASVCPKQRVWIWSVVMESTTV